MNSKNDKLMKIRIGIVILVLIIGSITLLSFYNKVDNVKALNQLLAEEKYEEFSLQYSELENAEEIETFKLHNELITKYLKAGDIKGILNTKEFYEEIINT